MDIFSEATLKLMSADAYRHYEDYIINRLTDVFEYGHRPTDADVADVVDGVIEYAEGMLPQDAAFGQALQREIIDSGLIDGMADDRQGAEYLVRG